MSIPFFLHADALQILWQSLGWPLCRLLLGLSLGLLVASILENLRWTQGLARLASPLSRAAHLPPPASAAFALAFVSPAAANGLLSESLNKGTLSRRELLLANIYNSLPAYILHTPTLFFLTWPVLGIPALTYVGLTLLAAVGRTALVTLLSRHLLPSLPRDAYVSAVITPSFPPCTALYRAWQRFLRRLPRLVGFTVPIYVLMFFLQHEGYFAMAEQWMAAHMDSVPFLKPQALGVVVLHLAAELGAALGAAGSILQTGALSARDVVLALLVGNILSTPMRALRHQFPAYAGFFRPSVALCCLVSNQGLRAMSMTVVTVAYASLP